MSFKFPSYLLSGILLCATVFSLPACASDIQSIEKLANQGDAKAQYEWGMLLVDGDKVKQDTITGRKWVEKAAEQGYTDAQTQLGQMCTTAEGIPATVPYAEARDYKSAKKWFEKAAAKGDKKAYYFLGNLYKDGNGVQRDYNKSFEYIKKAADKGYAEAQNDIGSMYYFGMKPMSRDYNQARIWFEKAAIQNDRTAKNYLAGMYRLGMGVPVDINKAKSMYKKLCDEGQEIACYTYKDIEKEGK